MRITIVITGVAAILAACVAPSDQPDLGPVRFAAAEQGRSIAETRCASCHGIGASLDSPRSAAPSFRRLKPRYVEVTLHRKLTEIAETGHYEMPPLQLNTNEVEAIVAYLESLPDQ